MEILTIDDVAIAIAQRLEDDTQYPQGRSVGRILAPVTRMPIVEMQAEYFDRYCVNGFWVRIRADKFFLVDCWWDDSVSSMSEDAARSAWRRVLEHVRSTTLRYFRQGMFYYGDAPERDEYMRSLDHRIPDTMRSRKRQVQSTHDTVLKSMMLHGDIISVTPQHLSGYSYDTIPTMVDLDALKPEEYNTRTIPECGPVSEPELRRVLRLSYKNMLHLAQSGWLPVVKKVGQTRYYEARDIKRFIAWLDEFAYATHVSRALGFSTPNPIRDLIFLRGELIGTYSWHRQARLMVSRRSLMDYLRRTGSIS